jgi:site-specific DNA recombinase
VAKKLRAAIYARLSDDDGDAASIGTQVRQCKEYALANGYRIVAVYDRDAGVSGGVPPNKRPDCARMYAARDCGEFDAVIITEPTRLYRSDMLAAELRRWQHSGVQVLFVGKEIDMTRDSWELEAGIHGVMGQQFRRMISRKTHAAHLSRVQRRSWVAGRPYGYDVGNDGDRKVLVRNRDQVPVVRRIFDRWNAGASCTTIARELNTAGTPSPGSRWANRKVRRSAGWVSSAVRVILKNPVYTGHVLWNRTQWVLIEDGSRAGSYAVSKRRADEMLSYHEEAYRLLKDDVFKRAQQRFREVTNDDPRLKSGGKAVYRLSGLLTCGECGGSFVLDGGTHYSCTSARNHARRRKDGHTCENTVRVRRDVAERIILGKLDEMLLDPTLVKEMAKEMQRELNAQLRVKRPASEATGEAALLDERIKRLRKRLKEGDPDLDADELEVAIEKAEAKRAALAAAPATQRDADRVVMMLPKAAEAYRRMVGLGLTKDPEAAAQARTVLRQLVGGGIKLVPIQAKGGRPAHVEARFSLQRMALLAPAPVGKGAAPTVGSVVAGAGFEPATFGL